MKPKPNGDTLVRLNESIAWLSAKLHTFWREWLEIHRYALHNKDECSESQSSALILRLRFQMPSLCNFLIIASPFSTLPKDNDRNKEQGTSHTTQHRKLAHKYEILSFSRHDHLPATDTGLTPCWEQLLMLTWFLHRCIVPMPENVAILCGVLECHINLMTFWLTSVKSLWAAQKVPQNSSRFP